MDATPRRISPTPTARRRRSTASQLALVVFAFLAGIGILGAVVVVGGYFALSRGLDDPHDLLNFQPAQESVVYDRTGKVELARFGQTKRDPATFQELPPVLVDAVTAVEDKSFWTNAGFDPAAIIASGVDALRGNARGASTITQQLVRQRLLDPKLVQSPGRTVERKLKEIVQSIRLTQAFPGETGKQDIITAYLNQNYYGNNSYGVKAAARTYFGKDLKDLSLSEVALLAALPQSPSSYDLVRNSVREDDGTLVVPDDTDIVQRRNFVLDLLASGRTPLSGTTYSAADFEAAKEERVVLAAQTQERWTAPQFVWALRAELATRLCGADAQTCPELEHGGLRITSTLDTRLQDAGERWVKAATIVPKAKDPAQAAKDLGLTYASWMKNLRNKDLNNGALVALDYQTGELVAYVGSADYYATKATKKFQPQFDVVGSGWRQPGSAFKPFNYLTGIDDKRITAGTMFMDVGTDFGGGYTPSDADNLERGPVRMRSALQFSLNIPSVKAMAVNGPDHVFQRAQDFGLRFRTKAVDAGLAFALGVEEVRPVDLVTGYGTIANGGRYLPHTTILRIQDVSGADVVDPYKPPEGKQVASPEAAAIITDVLAGNTDRTVNPFWGQFAVTSGKDRRPATLKTGTNNDAKDLNAYGFIAPPSADGRTAGEHALAVGVWNGNSDNSVVSTPNRPVFSIDVSTFVWQGFMNEATKGWAINDFARPNTLVSAPVDPWTGLKPAAGGKSVDELFIAGTEPKQSVGAGGVCGSAVLDASPIESHADTWLKADRDWVARAQRGPGVRGGAENNRTAYFYNGQFQPYGRSWGPLLNGAGCETPAPSPTCFPVPTPDASGVVPSFVVPTPNGSEPAPLPCPTAPPAPSESPSAVPSESATPPPSEAPTPTPTPQPTPPPKATPTPTPPPPPTATPTPAVSPAAPAGSSSPAPG